MYKLIALSYLLSTDRKRVQWRTVYIGLLLQISLGYLFLRFGTGREADELTSKGIQEFLDLSLKGA